MAASGVVLSGVAGLWSPGVLHYPPEQMTPRQFHSLSSR